MKSGIKLIVFIAYVFITFPAPAEEILIKNASIHTLTGAGTLENADILIRNGSISALGTDIDSSSVGKVIDASDKHVTPGLINAYTYLGIREISVVKGTDDVSTEDEQFSSAFNIFSAVNPSSTLLPHNLIHGLTYAIIAPESEHHVFAGQGAVLQLGKPSLILNKSAAMFARLGSSSSGAGGGSRASSYLKMQQALSDTQEYKTNRHAVMTGNWRDFSLEAHDLEALIPVIDGDLPLVVNVHRASDISMLLELKKQFGFKLVIAGASEAWRVADKLAKEDVAVIIDPMANLPIDFDQLAARLDAAALLDAAGVTVLFTGVDFHNTHSAFLVRQAAGNAVAYGMDKIAALKAMTLNPASVFGFADKAGSLEPGKQANLVIWDGDPLEIMTLAEQVIVNGKIIPMISRSTRLRGRYLDLDNEAEIFYRK